MRRLLKSPNAMLVRRMSEAPRHERGEGQTSYLLLAEGTFGARNLAVTWVDAEPGSQQEVHAHPDSEQVYVVVSGRGAMIVADEEQEVGVGSLVFIPKATPHAIRNDGPDRLTYVSATSPPFPADVDGTSWRPASEEEARG